MSGFIMFGVLVAAFVCGWLYVWRWCPLWLMNIYADPPRPPPGLELFMAILSVF